MKNWCDKEIEKSGQSNCCFLLFPTSAESLHFNFPRPIPISKLPAASLNEKKKKKKMLDAVRKRAEE